MVCVRSPIIFLLCWGNTLSKVALLMNPKPPPYVYFFPTSSLPGSKIKRSSGGFYPQRCGQAVVTDVVRSPRRYVPSFSSRIRFSISTARRFSSNVANSRFPLLIVNFYARKSPYEYVHSVGIELSNLILVMPEDNPPSL